MTLIVSLEIIFVFFRLFGINREEWLKEREQKCAHASLQTTSYTSLMSLPNFTINTKVPTFASYRDTFSKYIDQILQQQQHQLNDNM